MRRSRCLWAAAVGIAWGCAGDDSGGDYPDAGGGYCEMQMSFQPSEPEEGTAVVVDGSIATSGLFGTRDYTWRVNLGGQTIPHQSRAVDNHAIEFLPAVAGVYRVELDGAVAGTSCTSSAIEIPVSAAGANTVMYRLRLVPGSQAVPLQEKIVAIKGGSGSWPLGELSLETGLDASGVVTGTSLGPLPAYLRASKVGGDGFPDSETFAGATGAFSLRLMSGTYDVLVVPELNRAAPVVFAGLSPGAIASGLEVEPGTTVSGVVLDSSGAPLAGAQVSMRVGKVPSTIGTTDASGNFSIELRSGPMASVSVVPAAAGLPRLELAPSAILDGTTVTIQYAAATPRTVDTTVTFADGTTPAPGARVTFVARPIGAAGTVTVTGGSHQASGAGRVSVIAGAGGQLSVVLPAAVYDVIASPPAGAAGTEVARLTSIDLTGTNPVPPAISLASAATVTGSVTDLLSAALAEIRVIAVPRGLLTNLVPTVTATTTSDGSFSLALVGGGSYDVRFEAADQAFGLGSLALTAPAAGMSASAGTVALVPAISVTGSLSVPGSGPAAGVTALLYCYECTGMAANEPVAVGVTDSTGEFRLAVPDPGVGGAP